MNEPVAIRRATRADAAALAEFGARCFHDSYAAQNNPADMVAHLARTFSEDIQAREIADPASSCWLAEADGRVLGYALIQLGAVHARVAGPAPCEVKRFYVDRAWHGRGIAPALMGAARDAARRAGAGTLWLTAWEHNARALAFYAKMGFVDVGTATFVLGDSAQVDRLLRLPLETAAPGA